MPPRGSFTEAVMVEMISRERWTELAKLEFELTTQGIFAGGKGQDVVRIVKQLSTEVRSRMFHYGFSSRRILAKLRAEVAQLRDEQRRLKVIDAMTVD